MVDEQELKSIAAHEDLILRVADSIHVRRRPHESPQLREQVERMAREHLGPRSVVTLLLRGTDAGDAWHEGPGRHEGPVAPIELPLLSRDARSDDLRDWWRRQREGRGRPCLSGLVRGDEGAELWRDGAWRRCDSLEGRVAEVRAALREARRESPGWADAPTPRATWCAWLDGEPGAPARIAVEFTSERSGPVVGVLLLEPERRAAVPSPIEVTLVAAWKLCLLTVDTYWSRWDHRQAIAMEHAIVTHVGVHSSLHDPRRTDRPIPSVGKALQPLMLHLAKAFQAPAAGLFVPESSGEPSVELLAHVGYRHEGESFRDPSMDLGLAHFFCFRATPTIASDGWRREAFHCEDDASYRRACDELRADLQRRRPTGRVGSNLASYVPRESVPRAYAPVELDPIFWPRAPRLSPPIAERVLKGYGLDTRPKERPTGTLKVRGRVPHALDRPEAPPAFTRRERDRMVHYAGLFAAIVQRLLHLQDAQARSARAARMLTALSSDGVGGMLAQLRRDVGAGVAMLLAPRDTSGAIPCVAIEIDRDDPDLANTSHLSRALVAALRSGGALNAIDGARASGAVSATASVAMAPRRRPEPLSAFVVRLGTAERLLGYLVVADARPEVPQATRADLALCEEVPSTLRSLQRRWPGVLDERVREAAMVLSAYLLAERGAAHGSRAERSARPADAALGEAWRRLTSAFDARIGEPAEHGAEQRARMKALAVALAGLAGDAATLSTMASTSRPTVYRVTKRLYGRTLPWAEHATQAPPSLSSVVDRMNAVSRSLRDTKRREASSRRRERR